VKISVKLAILGPRCFGAAAQRYDHVNSSVPVTRAVATVKHLGLLEKMKEVINGAILGKNVGDENPTTGYVLHLGQARLLTIQLANDCAGRFAGSARRLQHQIRTDGAANLQPGLPLLERHALGEGVAAS
jgi:hypothetical protein